MEGCPFGLSSTCETVDVKEKESYHFNNQETNVRILHANDGSTATSHSPTAQSTLLSHPHVGLGGCLWRRHKREQLHGYNPRRGKKGTNHSPSVHPIIGINGVLLGVVSEKGIYIQTSWISLSLFRICTSQVPEVSLLVRARTTGPPAAVREWENTTNFHVTSPKPSCWIGDDKVLDSVQEARPDGCLDERSSPTMSSDDLSLPESASIYLRTEFRLVSWIR